MTASATDIVADCVDAISRLPEVASCTLTPTRNRTEQGRSDLIVALAGLRAQWQLRVELSTFDGAELPNIYLEIGASLLGHVSHERKVCFNDGEGLSVDLDRPVDVVVHAIKESIAILDQALQDHQRQPYESLLEEMEGYWNSIKSSKIVDSFVQIDDVAREIYAVVSGDKRNQTVHTFLDSRTSESANYGGRAKVRGMTKVCALYLPLVTPVLPPPPEEPIRKDFLMQLGAALSPNDREQLVRVANRKLADKRLVYLLMSQPRPGGGRATFGLAVSRNLGADLFAERNPRNLSALHVVRHDTQHVRERGGANLALANAHIVVVGCGSVGSRIAEFLALAGVGRLTLVDHDKLTSDNIFRHVLGGADIGKDKVNAMAAHLETRLPGIKVVPFVGRLRNWEASEHIGPVDGIVLALGDITAERAFTRHWKRAPYSRFAIVSWLEALGLGGHALLFSAGREGCLECLYTLSEGQQVLTPKTSYLEPGQRISRNLTGCGGSFTPFSALDAVKTAERAVDLCIRALVRDADLAYSSWKGGDEAAQREGLRTTEWYRRVTPVFNADREDNIFSCTCSTCRARAG